jgi:mRNA interferase YafQ
MLESETTGVFKKDLKLMEKRNCKMDELKNIMTLLINEQPLPERCRPHALHGSYEGKTECHVLNDWLLVYVIDNAARKIIFHRTGTHSDLF